MSEVDDLSAEIAALASTRARYVGIITETQAELTALEAMDLDDADYYAKRTEYARTIAGHQAEVARINAQLKAANIARADRQVADAETKRIERAARAAENAIPKRRKPHLAVLPPVQITQAPLTVPLGELAGIARTKRKGPSDLGAVILRFAYGLRHVTGIPSKPGSYLTAFLAELDAFIAKHKAHLQTRNEPPGPAPAIDAGSVILEVDADVVILENGVRVDAEEMRRAFQERTGLSVVDWLVEWRAGRLATNGSTITLSYEAALLEKRP